jgi:hypothetical protein
VTVYSVSAKKWLPGEIAAIESVDDSEHGSDGEGGDDSPQRKRYVNVRYWKVQSHRAKRVPASSRDLRLIDAPNRFDWDEGTILECWSNTNRRWFSARVTAIRREDDGYNSDGELDPNRIWLELHWEIETKKGDIKRLSKEFTLSSYWLRAAPITDAKKALDRAEERRVSDPSDDPHDADGGRKRRSESVHLGTLPLNVTATSVTPSRRKSSDTSAKSGDKTQPKSPKNAESAKGRKAEKTRIENALAAFLDPNSEGVYFLANIACGVVLLVLLVLYLISPSIHFLIMGFLALGLLGSVNYVWTFRNRALAEMNEKHGDGTSSGSSTDDVDVDTSSQEAESASLLSDSATKMKTETRTVETKKDR